MGPVVSENEYFAFLSMKCCCDGVCGVLLVQLRGWV